VPPQSKRRRLSLFTLPIVVVAGFLVVAKLTAWQRSDLIADLADCIAHGETRDAIEAVHKLAAIPNPPIPVLVTAAASDEHETAGAAQVAIDRLLRRWQREVEAKKRYNAIGGELSELAKSLSETRPDFSETDHVWLANTVRKILRIANAFPASQTPLVAVHCDAVLTAIGASRLPPEQDDTLPIDDFDDAVVTKSNGKTRSQAELDANGDQDSSARAQSAAKVPATLSPLASMAPIHSADDDAANNLSNVPRPNELRTNSGGSTGQSAADSLSSRPLMPRRPGSSPPVFRILPSAPINDSARDGQVLKRVTPDTRTAVDGSSQSSTNPLANTDTRELLKSWLASEKGDAEPMERELARRGFGRLSKPLVQRFFSENPQDRMRLVDNALAQPGSGSEAWLLLLAGDADPDVRLFAVTFMATSNNAALMEKAWQLAIRDHDPRVADLATRLRERNDQPFRR
jgi:hypothetical protein